ncbi:MAG: DUF2079 domain-containing protein [Anaerolineae bacterium]|nr:DUF2079 domain-containing protein [Anaerolineae bacterium]
MGCHQRSINWLSLWPHLLAGGLVLLYIVTFTWLAVLRHASFNSTGFDLGVYDQVTWNTLHGRLLFYTTTGQPLLHLSNHASFILILIAPFYLIHNGPETLLFLQAASIGLGGLPLFWLAREKLASNLAAFSLLLAYLLFPTLEIATLWDFHPPVLAVGFFMAAFYLLVKRKSGWFLFFAILAMLSKEQLPLQVAFLGGFALIAYRNWRLGLVTIGLALSYFFMVMYWVIPANSVTADHLFISYYADLGDSPTKIIATALTRPDIVLNDLWQPAKLRYLINVFTPFAYLPLLGLPVLLIGAPSFAINLLSANPTMHDAFGGHYGADIAPWLAWATLYGFYYAHRGVAYRWPQAQPWLTRGLSLILLLAAGGWHLFYGFSPLALNGPTWEITPHHRLAERFMAQIPPDASVASQNTLYPHVSRRLIAYHVPDINEAEYVWFDVSASAWPLHPFDLRTLIQELLRSGEYGILDAADGYLLLQRGLTNTTLPDAFYDFARAPAAQPQYPLRVDFGDEIRLLGFDLRSNPRRREETWVRLYWQALKPIEHDLRLYPFFVNARGEIIEDTAQRPLITQLWYPPRMWQPGEIVASETIPWAVGERWSLGGGVLAGSDWRDWSQRLRVQTIDAPQPLRRFEANTWVRLATFERQGRYWRPIVPSEADLPPTHAREANFGNQMQLRGYDVAQTGPDLAVTLYWRALAPMPLDYTIFVHVVGPDGQLVAQHDGSPGEEVSLPTSTWQPGEELRDRHGLTLPPDLPPGTYRLQMGVYYWQTLERLPVLENGAPVDDFVELESINLE